MNESISEIQRLLEEIAGHLKSGTKTDTRKAVAKLERIASLASTLGPHDPGTPVALLDRQDSGGAPPIANAVGSAPDMVACDVVS